MLLLTEDSTTDEIVVTLYEKQTLANPYYLFVFSHITTKQTVKFIKGQSDELSDYPERFSRFAVNTAVLFLDKPLGQWLYKVYEQASSTNTDETGLTELERGKMDYIKADEFEYAKYEPATTYKAYAG